MERVDVLGAFLREVEDLYDAECGTHPIEGCDEGVIQKYIEENRTDFPRSLEV